MLQHNQERDPIERVRKLIFAHDLATPAELKVWAIINSKMLFQSVHVLVFNIIIISGYGERNQETS